ARAHAAPDAGARTDPDVPSNRKLILPLSLSESVEFRPNAVELRFNLGLALAKTGQTEQAISAFLKARELDARFELPLVPATPGPQR
ncbi:MAG: tetratricopeptide repeat protein, partial [Acidobacteriia bacterium]|nr:tetratricopeptide repeat protein [Terriglobia bacterium]